MEFNNKKLEKTSKWINYTIAIVLCGFLISLSNKLIKDVDQWEERPTVNEFEDKSFLKTKKEQQNVIDQKIDMLIQKKSSITNTINVVNSNYTDEKKSFDNWIEARKTIGSPKEDKEVLARANKLDEYYKTQQDWKMELTNLNVALKKLKKERSILATEVSKENERAYKSREIAVKKYEVKVFLIRLLFILPILLLGVFFMIKCRKHKYWPLFLGFVLFSFYAFFFGLIPYLPSYGGYIRYSVGIILCVILGVFVINKIKKFIALKKIELEASTTDRAKKVQIETAEKALENHICPSCGKDFITQKLDQFFSKKKLREGVGIVTNFCRFCGLELFKQCSNCGEENFAHLPFCAKCGDKVSVN